MDKLKVTDCSVYTYDNPERKLKAEARITLNKVLHLTNLRLYEGSHGLFVSYPTDNYRGEDYRQVFYPLTMELREHIEAEIIKAYHEELKRKEEM